MSDYQQEDGYEMTVFADPYVVINVVPLEKRPIPQTAAMDDSDTTPLVPKEPKSAKKAVALSAMASAPPVTCTGESPSHVPMYSAIPAQPAVPSKAAKLFSTLHFSLYHDIQRSILTVRLLKATNLAMRRKWSGSKRRGIFVVLHLHPSKEQVFESRPVSDLVNPSFDQVFEFNLTAEAAARESIVFRVYEGTGPSRGHLIGLLVVPLIESDLLGVTTVRIIDDGGQGISVSLSLDVFRHLLATQPRLNCSCMQTAKRLVDS